MKFYPLSILSTVLPAMPCFSCVFAACSIALSALFIAPQQVAARDNIVPSADAASFAAVAEPFLKQHCICCHGPEMQEGDVRLDQLNTDAGHGPAKWLAVRNQIRDGLMPPEDEPRPDAASVKKIVAWLTDEAAKHPPRLPNEGNLVPHDALFGQKATGGGATPARLWRLSPQGYAGFARDVHRGRQDGLVTPFVLTPDRGVRDFAELYKIDEASTEILLRNASQLVDAQTAHSVVDGKVQGKGDTVPDFIRLLHPDKAPERAAVESAVSLQFRLAIGRNATDEEKQRFYSLYQKCAAEGDHRAAAKTTLQAVLLKAEAMYRSEMGEALSPNATATPSNTTLTATRAKLSQHELARALSLTFGTRRETLLFQAADKGELNTREQVAAHIDRIWNDPKADKSRVWQFFREYFEYNAADEVFKDKPVGFLHEPKVTIADTDKLVAYIVEQDEDVFRRLLTTPLSYVNLKLVENKETRKVDVPSRATVPKQPDPKKKDAVPNLGVEGVYGVEKWPEKQPAVMPANTRIGILMQPSWLAAWSTNFDNDPVRRGRWIRERLLGGTVPDLPIGVAAQVPDDPHRTFRDRLQVTRDAKCWKCHQQMDELGLPLEQFDHYGRYRTAEPVVDLEATEKNVDKKGNPLGKVYRDAELVTTGKIEHTGDKQLDGPVRDPREMITRIANSDRARQVFVRHVFRYFMGRNESLADAGVLQDADRAYVASGGSFKELVKSLLTSEAFLVRVAPPQTAAK